IGIIITTSILFVFPLVLNQNRTAMAQQQLQQQQQQQMQANQTFTPSVEEQRQLLEGISFQINNVTFRHGMASVNGIQMHYVIGGQGDPVVLLHGWPETWYAWHKVMPDLAQNYTVIAPDLRGLGDSSKPTTGYDGKTVAEDIHQLVTQLGFKTIFLVGHDIGTQVAYSYAAAHPTEVKRLVVMDLTIPGFEPPGMMPIWWRSFHQTPDIPEALVQGKEMMYLSWFYRNLAYNPSAITQTDINEFVSHYSAPGGMRAGFEYYRAFPEDAIQNINYSKTKLTMPVLALGAGYIPIFGGNITMPTIVYGMHKLAQNATGITVPNSGHWIPEEQPAFVIKMLNNFFASNSTKTK
ncbi:MAG TPA: alpha/beta hydrolase, partial [Nitrososphaeraceae archaeon]|nr:alpha/beta hydrolase [Nitrososphaeraceae archaeon]